ncbi:MAG TPA: glycoside hydrolase family 9 protein [Planctomycetota bacterium]|nr:glycoside hydrolase family 9 protein [Planctomycetota bacterium]
MLAGAADAPVDTAKLPPAVTTKSVLRIWVDQFGYRTKGRKLVIVASDAAMPASLNIEMCDAATQTVVWESKQNPDWIKPYKNGAKDIESGDFVAHLDLSAFTKPGRYYLTVDINGTKERSYLFNIGDEVYKQSGLAAWKAFYYNRADCEKPEKYAGLWSHGDNHKGPGQATEARIYKWTGNRHPDPVGKEILDPTPYDVRGGWWDAGDFNKYTGNTVQCHNEMLMAVQLLGAAAKDNQLNIPESGNGVPDILDEARYGTEYLIRIADSTGAAFGKVHELGTSPPEADKTPVQLTVQTSCSTMSRCAALAYAAVVWKESKLDDVFAKKCQEEAEKAWKLLEEKPFPWPVDPKNPQKQAYTGDWFDQDFGKTKATAAAAFFRLTKKPEYEAIVKDAAAKWNRFDPGDNLEIYPLILIYTHTPDADAATVSKMKKLITDAADTAGNWSGFNRGYGAGLKGYWWGSNRTIGQVGVVCLVASEFSTDAAAKQKYLDTAEEYVHYLNGRNPIGRCYLSNMKQFGAEHSTMVMFHSWVGRDNDKFGAKYIGEGEGKIGPFPGMVVGGVNGSMKKYVDKLDWRTNPWEFNEPDITYQSPCATLLGYFALKVK